MTNRGNCGNRQPSRKDVLARNPAFTWVRYGWNDALAGRPYRPEYETADLIAQGNYEIGRIQAANTLAAGLPAPKWPESVVLPKWVGPTWERAAEIAGNARCDIKEA